MSLPNQQTVYWKLQEFVAHGEDVSCLCMGQKTAKIMATGSLDKSVNIWSVDKPHSILKLGNDTAAITCVNFNVTDELLLSGTQSGVIKLWDLEAAKKIRSMSCHKAAVTAFAFHPFADVVATGAADSSLKMWDLRRKGLLYQFRWHSSSITSVEYSPDGRWIASTSEDGTAKLTELTTGKQLADFNQHSAGVNQGVFHPHEFLLATCSNDRTVKLWDLETFECIGSSVPESQPIKRVLFENCDGPSRENGGTLITASASTLRMYCIEPEVVQLDSVAANWGHVGAMGQIHSQVVVASYKHTNVSTHVVDLSKLTSKGIPVSAAAAPSPLSPAQPSGGGSKNSSIRKNFTKEARPPTGVTSNDADDEDTENSQVLINNPQDYDAIFRPKQKLDRSPTRDSQMFRPPGAVGDVPERPFTSCSNNVNGGGGLPQVPQANVPRQSPMGAEDRGRGPAPPPVGNRGDASLLTEFENKVKRERAESQASATTPEGIFARVAKGHETVTTSLSSRCRNLEIVRAVLSSPASDYSPASRWKRAVDTAVGMHDTSVIHDLLSLLNLRQSCWTLDLSCHLLPSIVDLCRAKHEPYNESGCTAMRLILKLFGNLIKQNVETSSAIGVDISHEDRAEKCRRCYAEIKSALPYFKDKSILPGKQGAMYKELVILITSKL